MNKIKLVLLVFILFSIGYFFTIKKSKEVYVIGYSKPIDTKESCLSIASQLINGYKPIIFTDFGKDEGWIEEVMKKNEMFQRFHEMNQQNYDPSTSIFILSDISDTGINKQV